MSYTINSIPLVAHVNNRFRIKVPAKDIPFIDSEESFKHVAAKLVLGDIIEYIADDYSVYGELLVVDLPKGDSKHKTWAKVRKVFEVNFEEKAEKKSKIISETTVSSTDDYIIEWNDGVSAFRIIRSLDGQVIGEETTKIKARKFLADYLNK